MRKSSNQLKVGFHYFETQARDILKLRIQYIIILKFYIYLQLLVKVCLPLIGVDFQVRMDLLLVVSWSHDIS